MTNEEESPVAGGDEAPVVLADAPIVLVEAPVVHGEAPVVHDEAPAVVDEPSASPSVEGSPIVTSDVSTAAVEVVPTVDDDTPPPPPPPQQATAGQNVPADVPAEVSPAFDFQYLQSLVCGVIEPLMNTPIEEPPPPAGFWHETESLRNAGLKVDEDLRRYTTAGESVKTLFQTFEFGVKRDPAAPCLGKRKSDTAPYSWKTYQDIQSEAERIGRFLKGLGVSPGQRVGLSGKNAPEYLTAIQGCFWAGATTVRGP
jgi:AMP-binding enzyme